MVKCCEDIARSARIVALYRTGQTLQEIGDGYGISRERVRQIVSKYGVTAREGGEHARMERRETAASAARKNNQERRCQRLYGCSFVEMIAICEAAKGVVQQPTKAFYKQRGTAINRGIDWKLTLKEWWGIWEASGHWEDRGRGVQKFAMCRYGDSGPYSCENVFIGLFTENVSEAQKRLRGVA